MQHRPIIPLLFILASTSAGHAQSAFDGFRMGIEATYSETSFRVDAAQAKEAALSSAREQMSRGEERLAASVAQLEDQRAAFDAASRAHAERQDRLQLLEQQVAANPRTAALVTPTMMQLRTAVAQGAVSLQTASTALAAGAQATEAGKVRLAEAGRRIAEMEAYPQIATSTLSGTAVRFSAGWGTSWETQGGGIYLGGEVDATPGTGRTTVRAPGHYSTRIEGRTTLGASARVGWIPVSWAMPFLTVGAETQTLGLERNHKSTDRQTVGFRAGFGVEFAVSESTILRVGYDHTMVPETSFAGARITPSRDTYRVGLVRHF